MFTVTPPPDRSAVLPLVWKLTSWFASGLK
jgi:hypothetical protein